MIVLYSSLESTSREFIEQVPDDIIKIDWYMDDRSNYLGASPSRFPSVYMPVNRSPATTKTFGDITVDIPQLPENCWGLLVEPKSWQEVLDTAAMNPNQDLLTSFVIGE